MELDHLEHLLREKARLDEKKRVNDNDSFGEEALCLLAEQADLDWEMERLLYGEDDYYYDSDEHEQSIAIEESLGHVTTQGSSSFSAAAWGSLADEMSIAEDNELGSTHVRMAQDKEDVCQASFFTVPVRDSVLLRAIPQEEEDHPTPIKRGDGNHSSSQRPLKKQDLIHPKPLTLGESYPPKKKSPEERDDDKTVSTTDETELINKSSSFDSLCHREAAPSPPSVTVTTRTVGYLDEETTRSLEALGEGVGFIFEKGIKIDSEQLPAMTENLSTTSETETGVVPAGKRNKKTRSVLVQLRRLAVPFLLIVSLSVRGAYLRPFSFESTTTALEGIAKYFINTENPKKFQNHFFLLVKVALTKGERAGMTAAEGHFPECEKTKQHMSNKEQARNAKEED
eukprot:CAMPEP_0195507826 /NCGR_PEP_ID=MMETSP0794_2-20130614/1192_1 /TAXON_ID=515487 /ORGANISM="Stephanopyxis turris, Strain CCMP 815" /LENGTH=397 /DNA_ID=CAMNT_0040634633 /DNA_START=309 /DNA_END=1503 /DNA_ORIENTATION=+